MYIKAEMLIVAGELGRTPPSLVTLIGITNENLAVWMNGCLFLWKNFKYVYTVLI